MPVVDDDPFGPVKSEQTSQTPSPREVGVFHHRSDVDASVFSHHHTLGTRHNQATYGDHTHNGRDSKLLNVNYGPILVGVDSIGAWRYVEKAADTSRVNTVVRSADPELTLPVSANAFYWFEFMLSYTGLGDATDGGDLSMGLNSPAGSTIVWSGEGHDTAMTTAGFVTRGPRTQSATTTSSSGTRSTGIALIAYPRGSLRTINAGNFALNWTQATASATATVVQLGSLLRLHRLA